ncbi:MAG: hypothetical protein HC887_10410 [Desulfobacteraceae bacterium]|nr:hypothetical protein [Desulfobacteraceae bacterium]
MEIVAIKNFMGSISGQTMTGKIYVHFPVDYQTSCPSQWVSGFDLTLTMSSDGKTIEGQYVAGSLYSNCSIVMDTTSVTIKFTRKSQCFHVNDDLKINVTCAEYQGTKYKVNLNYVSGVLWKADTSTFGIGDSGNCISVANDLKLNMSCAEYKGNIYGFIMDLLRNNDPSVFIGKLILIHLLRNEFELSFCQGSLLLFAGEWAFCFCSYQNCDVYF